MEDPRIISTQFNSPKMPYYNVLVNTYYFETVPPERLKKLVADYTLPKSYEARLVLSQYEMHDFGVYQTNAVQIYLAPGKDVDVYAAEKMYADQHIDRRKIGVDTARYIIGIDERLEEFHTGADGYWGDACEYSHTKNERKQVDGMMIMMTMPEEVSFAAMKQSMYGLFEGVQPMRIPGRQKPAKKQKQPER